MAHSRTATPDVFSRYGAPMGRRSEAVHNLDCAQRIQLFRIRLNGGGYDAGGAYWGSGQPLWCAMDHTGETVFFRAPHRESAKWWLRDSHDTPEAVRFYR